MWEAAWGWSSTGNLQLSELPATGNHVGLGRSHRQPPLVPHPPVNARNQLPAHGLAGRIFPLVTIAAQGFEKDMKVLPGTEGQTGEGQLDGHAVMDARLQVFRPSSVGPK